MIKRPLALVLGITGNLAFAAGCLLLAVKRHSPGLECDIVIYHDKNIAPHDADLLKNMGARLMPFHAPVLKGVGTDFLTRFSSLALVRFELLRLLRTYANVLYLDVDIAVQGDITPILDYGPFGVTLEDHSFVSATFSGKAGDGLIRPIPGFNMDAHNINSGVFFVSDALPEWEGMYDLYLKWLEMYGQHCIFLDQALLNFMAQRLERSGPDIVRFIPTATFNTHPYSPNAQLATLVHAFGENKFWNDALMRALCPEWGARLCAMAGQRRFSVGGGHAQRRTAQRRPIFHDMALSRTGNGTS